MGVWRAEIAPLENNRHAKDRFRPQQQGDTSMLLTPSLLMGVNLRLLLAHFRTRAEWVPANSSMH